MRVRALSTLVDSDGACLAQRRAVMKGVGSRKEEIERTWQPTEGGRSANGRPGKRRRRRL